LTNVAQNRQRQLQLTLFLIDGDERTTPKSALRAGILMKYDESSSPESV